MHRDVKPANILVDASPDRPDHVYLSDFGVSKGAVSSASLTGTGQFLGTPDYSAPEQIQGQAVDGRADQYALACVAYQLLTGGRPSSGTRHGGAAAHLSEPPPSLAARRPGMGAGIGGGGVVVAAVADFEDGIGGRRRGQLGIQFGIGGKVKEPVADVPELVHDGRSEPRVHQQAKGAVYAVGLALEGERFGQGVERLAGGNRAGGAKPESGEQEPSGDGSEVPIFAGVFHAEGFHANPNVFPGKDAVKKHLGGCVVEGGGLPRAFAKAVSVFLY